MTSAENRWQAVIDELRSDLDRIEAGLADDGPIAELGRFRPPADLPPLPRSMVEAARDLSRRHDALIQVMAERRSKIDPSRRTPAPARGPSRFEVRA